VAFHARNRRSSRTTRESSRESVFGLAGWLFADLLLALSVVFLVAQDRPSQETDKDAKIAQLEEIIKEKNSLIEEKETVIDKLTGRVDDLEAICDANGCAEASGLSPGKQLIIEVPGGAARGMTVGRMRIALDRAILTVEEVDTKKKTPTTWENLTKQNRRIGFVIFFTRDSVAVQAQAERNLGELVEVLVEKKLVDPDLQLEKSSGGNFRFDVFPNLTRYSDDFVKGDNLRIRALMFTYTSPLSGATTTTVED
jgi:hypothetical protein